jgi:serine/threonine-protein kinase
VIVGSAAVALVVGLVVVASLVLRGGQPHDTSVAATSSATPTPSAEAPAGPWQAYEFVAKALPGLMPDSPSGTAYLGATCEPVDIRFEPIGGVETAVPVARLVCIPARGAQSKYVANYIVICNSDRTPQTLAGVADTLTAPTTEQWSRGGAAGQIIYGTHNGAGAIAISFDSPARTFCSVIANGNDGTSGQDVYDHWFKDAPL